MSHPSKQKGNAYEREIVKQAKQIGLEAKRAWGSNGQSLGLHENVDLVIEGLKVQAKRRARIADYLKPDDDVDIQVLREDRGVSFAVMRLSDLLELIQQLKMDKP